MNLKKKKKTPRGTCRHTGTSWSINQSITRRGNTKVLRVFVTESKSNYLFLKTCGNPTLPSGKLVPAIILITEFSFRVKAALKDFHLISAI